MTIEQNRISRGVPTGGRYAPTVKAEATANLEQAPVEYPHPDTKFPPPINCWPAGVQKPESIRLEYRAIERAVSVDPQQNVPVEVPDVVITMANGATFTARSDEDNIEESFSGDWKAYLDGDMYNTDAVRETASETIVQTGL